MRFFFLLLFTLISLQESLLAQRSETLFQPFAVEAEGSASVRGFTDTLIPISFIPVNEGGLGCFTGYYNSPDSGYVSGNNQYGDREKAQFYSLTKMGYKKEASVQSVLVRAVYKTVSGSGESLVAKVWSCDSGRIFPDSLKAVSLPVAMSSISTDGSLSQFSFSQPVPVTDSFFISIELPTITGDTVVIQSTDDHCVAESGYSWEMWSDSTWHALVNSWILNIDLALFPVAEVELQTGIAVLEAQKAVKVFPNPASDYIRLIAPPPVSDLSDARMEVLNALGQICYAGPVTSQTGKDMAEVITSEWKNGLYLLRIHQGEQTYGAAFAIQH